MITDMHMDILMILTLIGFFAILLCIVLHSAQHFRCRFCVKYKYRMTSLPSYNTTNSGGFNGFSRNSRISNASNINANNTNRPSSINNQRLRVSNSINVKQQQQQQQQHRNSNKAPHHRTNSSLYENRFIASVSSIRTSFYSIHNHHASDPYKLVKRECQFCLFGVEEDFDFFPAAFLFYILFIICIVLLISIRFILIDTFQHLLIKKHNAEETTFTFGTLLIDKITRLPFHTITNLDTMYGAVDWIIAYCIIILSVWESLFNFYRFYTTMYAARFFCSIETKRVFQKYCYYLLIYCVIFLTNIHLYFWLFPVTILTHLLFNLYCTWMFAHILVVQYKHIISTDSFLTDVHDEMLSSVYLMRKFSMFSSILSSIYLSIFLISSNIAIVIYLPILWSICCVSFTLNFVRNRQYIFNQFYKIKHCLIINNFSLSSTTKDLKDKIVYASKQMVANDSNHLNNIENGKCLQSPTENGSIADLKRQHTKNNMFVNDLMHNDKGGHHLKLRNDCTLSTTTATTPTPQKKHNSLFEATATDTLPTLKKKQISMISEISNDMDIDEDEEAEGTDVDDDDEENGCFATGTPSSDILVSSESPLSKSMVMNDEHCHYIKKGLHQISITAPETISYLSTSSNVNMKRNILLPNLIRTRSATLDAPNKTTEHNAQQTLGIINILSDEQECDEIILHPMIKTRSDNRVVVKPNKSVAVNSTAHRFAPYKNIYSQPTHINYKFDLANGVFKGNDTESNHKKVKHNINISGMVIRSCGHTPQSTGINIWNVNKFNNHITITDTNAAAEDKYDADEDDADSLGSVAMFVNDIALDLDIEHTPQAPYTPHAPQTPHTPQHRCKALELLGINSNENSATLQRHVLKNNPSLSGKSNVGNKRRRHTPKLSFIHKISKSKSKHETKIKSVSDRHPFFGVTTSSKQPVLTQSTSQHLELNVNAKKKCKDTPKSLNNLNINSFERNYSDNSNKSFSKTLTQSELRNIVYDENDVILMEAINNKKENECMTPNMNIFQLLSKESEHTNTFFISNSYHTDNARPSLNKRIFELLNKNKNSKQQPSSLPPKMPDLYGYDEDDDEYGHDQILDLRKAYSLPNDNQTVNNNHIDINFACDEIEESEELQHVIVDIAKITNNKIILPALDSSEDGDDETLISEMLTLQHDTDRDGENAHERNATNITITYNAEMDMDDNDVNDMDDIDLDDDIEEEEKDFFPSPEDAYADKLRKYDKGKHAASRSLLDEFGRFAQMFHNPQSSKNSTSFSQSNKLKMENQRKRRSRSMPSMDEINNDSNESVFDDQHTNDDEEHGDIVSLLSVLVQHGFYSKQNLNSVQQLTHYNAKQ